SPKQAEKFVSRYETARKMVLDNVDPSILSAYVRKHLPYKSGEEFRNLFRVAGDPKTNDRPFAIDTPFVVTRPGERAGSDLDLSRHFGREVVSLSDDPHNLDNLVESRFAQERTEGLSTIKEIGTEANPVFKMVPAQTLSPMESMQRSMQDVMRSRFYRDY